MNKAYLLLGSNLGDRNTILENVRLMISKSAGAIVASSSIYETEPWGFESDNRFLNQAIVIETVLAPLKLLETLLGIEEKLGRTRKEGAGYASRKVDIDILFYNEEVIKTNSLEIPHPRLHERLFALLPLCEIDDKFVHPIMQKTMGDLARESTDKGQVKMLTCYTV